MPLTGKKYIEIRPVYLLAIYSTDIPGPLSGIVRIVNGCFLINHLAGSIPADPGNLCRFRRALDDFGVQGSVRHFGNHYKIAMGVSNNEI